MVIIGLIGISFYCALSYSLGLRIHMGHRRTQSRISKDGITPLGIVSVVDPAGGPVSGDNTGIWAYDHIYEAMGVTKKRLDQWQNAHGMDSLGVDQRGSYLAPEYPIFSKVAWMFIDPVDLSRDETANLIVECNKLIAASNDSTANEELNRIRKLASTALERSQTLRFGHP
jgi:hypothetical protein